MRGLLLVIGSGAMLAGSLSAEAQQRRGDPRVERRDDPRQEHRRRDRRERGRGGSTAGGFALGALAVGLVAALAAKPSARAREVIVDADDVPVAAAAETDADAAVSACAAAVEGEGRRTFALAQTGTVRAATPFERGYAVEGDLLLRTGWRDAGERRGFRCTVDAQAVRTVAIEGSATLPPRP